jgi:hypothetical protein
MPDSRQSADEGWQVFQPDAPVAFTSQEISLVIHFLLEAELTPGP